MGLSLSEFWQSSLFDLSLMISGFYELEQERIRADYERDRIFTMMLLNIQIDKKHRFKTPDDFMPFPWEQEDKPEVKILSKKERFEKFARMDRAMKQKYG
jgi:hypothetical protein